MSVLGLGHDLHRADFDRREDSVGRLDKLLAILEEVLPRENASVKQEQDKVNKPLDDGREVDSRLEEL